MRAMLVGAAVSVTLTQSWAGLKLSPYIRMQARLAQVNRAMYARLSGTDRYQALKELAQKAQGCTYLVRRLVRQAEEPSYCHAIDLDMILGMVVCMLLFPSPFSRLLDCGLHVFGVPSRATCRGMCAV